MSKKRRARTGFQKMKDAELLAQGTTNLQAMANNPNFPDPVPSIEVFRTILEDYEERLGHAKQKGGYYEASLKKDSREVLENALKQWAFHVNVVSAGDLSMVLSSGFPLTAMNREIYEPEIVGGLRLKDGRQSGYMRFDFSKVDDVLLYEYQIAHEKSEDGELEWGLNFNTTSSLNNIISPVIPGVTYFARVRGVNGKGVGEWSEFVSRMAR